MTQATESFASIFIENAVETDNLVERLDKLSLTSQDQIAETPATHKSTPSSSGTIEYYAGNDVVVTQAGLSTESVYPQYSHDDALLNVWSNTTITSTLSEQALSFATGTRLPSQSQSGIAKCLTADIYAAIPPWRAMAISVDATLDGSSSYATGRMFSQSQSKIAKSLTPDKNDASSPSVSESIVNATEWLDGTASYARSRLSSRSQSEIAKSLDTSHAKTIAISIDSTAWLDVSSSEAGSRGSSQNQSEMVESARPGSPLESEIPVQAEQASKREYRQYAPSDYSTFIDLWSAGGISCTKAAQQANIKRKTAANWIKWHDTHPLEIPPMRQGGEGNKCNEVKPSESDDNAKKVLSEIVAQDPHKTIAAFWEEMKRQGLKVSKRRVKLWIETHHGFSLTLALTTSDGSDKIIGCNIFASHLLHKSISFHQNCAFIGHTEFTCQNRINSKLKTWKVYIMAAIFSNGDVHISQLQVNIDPSSSTLYAGFMASCLQHLRKQRGPIGFVFVNCDFMAKLPSSPLSNYGNFELIEFPCQSLNPVTGLWPLLLEKILKEMLSDSERVITRLMEGVESIRRREVIRIIQDAMRLVTKHMDNSGELFV